eukprot:220834_1
MAYKEDTNTTFKPWTCTECSYLNKRYLCCGRYVYGNRDESKCQFCGEDKSKSDGSKKDVVFESSEEDEKEWIKLIQPDNARFMNSDLITPQSYKLDEDFVNPSYDLNPPNPTFKAECVDTERFTQKEWNIILNKARSVQQNKEIRDTFKATQGAGFNVEIKKGDSVGIEHVMAALLYIHFPKYVYKYRVSLPSKFFHFHRFMYELVTYFGTKMASDAVVYHGLSDGLNVQEEKEEKKDKKEDGDDEDEDKRKNNQWEFLNTGFLTFPLSACRETNVFSKGTVLLTLKTQFVNEFNETRCFDLAPLSSFAEKDGKNEIVFMGEFSELSVDNISVVGEASADFKIYVDAINLWQMLSTGFADYNDKKYSVNKSKETQDALVKLLKEDKDVPKYMQQVFKYYNESKKGEKYHRCYEELLDIDFSNICKTVAKTLNKELQDLLFNDEVSDVDPAKIKKIFTKGKKYRDHTEKEKNF